MSEVYLDYAAATPMDDKVLMAMQPYFGVKFYNPSAVYMPAKQVNNEINEYRSEIAQLLGAKSSEIVFTAGGTEANNMAIKGVAWQFPDSHIVVSALEHESVLRPANYLAENGWNITELKPKPDGVINPTDIAGAITDKTVLISVMLANNEIGTVQPIRQIAKEIEQIRQDRQKRNIKLPIYLHTDACQAANYLDLHVNRLGVDLMTLNGGKIYGPKQSGLLFINTKVKLMPLIHGGGQELNMRSGTQNVAAIAGLCMALQIAIKTRIKESERLNKLQRNFINQLQHSIPGVIINGSIKYRLPNNVHITIPGTDNERLIFGLDERGVLCSAGSACSASKEESSHVLISLGNDDEYARSSIRFSMGRQTDESAINKAVKSLVEITK